MEKLENSYVNWQELSKVAWEYRDNAILIGKTKVGAAALSDRGNVFGGCNVEHKFRSHDIHAEVNCIGTMIANGEKVLKAIIVVAEREQFTPCGSCLDWVFQFGGPACFVGFQNEQGGKINIYTAEQLMPFYPR
jgi:cytidine deaminase